jgi:hypothetical protein
MHELLGDIPNIQVYLLDDVLITSNVTFEEHAAIIEHVLEILQKENFRANLRICYFGESKLIIYDMRSLEMVFNHSLRKWKRY